MASVPRATVDAFTKGINGISSQARQMLAARLAQIDIADVSASASEVVAVMEEYCAAATQNIEALANRFYRVARMQALGGVSSYEPSATSGRVPAATEEATRAILQRAVDGDVDGCVEQLLQRIDYEIKRGAGTTVLNAGQSDPLKPRYARVPTGAETCEFCIMLASRGFVYHSETSAGMLDHWHANCDCRIVPGFGKKPTVDGYDPDHYYDQYEELGMRERMRLYRAERGLNSRSVRSERLEQYMEQSAARRARNLSDAVDWIEDAQTVDELRERMGLLNDNLASMGISNEDSVKRLNAVLRRRRREIESAN